MWMARVLIAAGVLLLASLPSFAGQMVVIESTAPALKAGQMVDGAQTLNLAKGARVKLVSGDGGVVTLTGPYSGAPEAARTGAPAPAPSGGQRMLEMLSKLVGGKLDSSDIGAMRAGSQPTPPGPWLIAVLQPGNYCVRAGRAPELWREKSRKKAKLTIKTSPKGARATIPWPAKSDRVSWPRGVPIMDGGTYRAKVSGGTPFKGLTLHVVPGGLPTDVHRAAWMAEKGCLGQAKLVMRDLG